MDPNRIDLPEGLDKTLLVRSPLVIPTVDVPARFRGSDVIEIRVTLTPLRWHEADKRYERSRNGEVLGAQVQIVQLEARDARAVFSIVRDLLRNLCLEYLGLKDMF